MLHLKRLILVAAVSTLALAPAFAQEHHGGGHGPAPSGHFSGGHGAPAGHFAGGHGFAPGGHFAQNGGWHGGGHGPAPSGHFSGGHGAPAGHFAPGGHFAGGHGIAPGGHFVQNGGWHGGDRFADHGFDHWRGGHWVHGVHGGRFGWWWTVGPDWYYYDAPVYPYPDPYPYAEPYGATAWYYCPALNNYYPYVQSCPGPWQVVPQG